MELKDIDIADSMALCLWNIHVCARNGTIPEYLIERGGELAREWQESVSHNG